MHFENMGNLKWNKLKPDFLVLRFYCIDIKFLLFANACICSPSI